MMAPSARPAVCVFGSGDARPGDAAYEQARAAGAALVRLGYAVANGGYGGTMEASALGARRAGGATIGVSCSLWKSAPNAAIDEVIVTGSLDERVAKLVELGSGGYLALAGATGTLAELAWVWELVCKGFIPPRPIVCLGSFWRPLVEMMASQRPTAGRAVALVEDVDELGRHFPSRVRL